MWLDVIAIGVNLRYIVPKSVVSMERVVASWVSRPVLGRFADCHWVGAAAA